MNLTVRLDGDEFALLLAHCPVDVAQRIAESVRAAIAATVLTWNGQSLETGASLGVALLSDATESVAGWLRGYRPGFAAP